MWAQSREEHLLTEVENQVLKLLGKSRGGEHLQGLGAEDPNKMMLKETGTGVGVETM